MTAISLLAREVETVSRERKRRTRSRMRSHLDTLVVSTLPAHEYDLDPACISLVCPSCRTWVPVRVAQTERATAKLVPHHTEPAGTENPVRCPGSHRLVHIDVTRQRWSQRLTEGVAETDGRRSNRVTRKPGTAVAPAVTQIVGGLIDDKTARRLDEAHVKSCTACSVRDDEGRVLRAADISYRCADGQRLAQLAAHTKRTAPARRQAQMEREEQTDRRERGLRLLHHLPRNQHAKAVSDADVQRVDDALTAMIQMLNPHKVDAPPLSDWERADLLSAITLLATQKDQIERRR
ncbi:hypothetical protein AMK27_39980 [Streptomyces sp. CB02009]|uniref:hypothetical protein n=1 Tax=Streptomyces sp. CB02009 TaxID=1703938 RepID=UPI00093888AA|nr:hypothetical protein [Streptomyces sp. CB02009]OKJ45968.1 hypothetical protein AMK27_39980 [Streptomyces sp. CB02009]